MEWIKVTDEVKKKVAGEVVIGYSPKWIDEDWNQRGVRECFTCDAGENEWTSMKWCGYHDDWHCDNETAPTHICLIPDTSNIEL